MTLSQIRKAAQSGPAEARVHVQVEAASAKLTREQKPFCELALADIEGRMTLRVWSDHPEYKACGALEANDFIELAGEFQQHQQFGLDARRWKVRVLTPEEKEQLLQGPPNCERNRPRIGITFSLQRAQSLIRVCAHFVKHSLTNGATGFNAARQQEIIITRDAAVWLSTRRK